MRSHQYRTRFSRSRMCTASTSVVTACCPARSVFEAPPDARCPVRNIQALTQGPLSRQSNAPRDGPNAPNDLPHRRNSQTGRKLFIPPHCTVGGINQLPPGGQLRRTVPGPLRGRASSVRTVHLVIANRAWCCPVTTTRTHTPSRTCVQAAARAAKSRLKFCRSFDAPQVMGTRAAHSD